jgi:hypothetical protein
VRSGNGGGGGGPAEVDPPAPAHGRRARDPATKGARAGSARRGGAGRRNVASRGRERFNLMAARQAEQEVPLDSSGRAATPPDLWGRLAQGEPGSGRGVPRHSSRRRKLPGSLESQRVCSDAVQMRRALESMASEMRKAHRQANNQQRMWEEKRVGKQQRIEKLMHEARRKIGADIHREMVENERAKLKIKRTMPRRLKKHAQGWAGFEADVESGALNPIRLDDIPFPPAENPLCLPAAGSYTAHDRKQAFRQSSLRWHPDKFTQRCDDCSTLTHPSRTPLATRGWTRLRLVLLVGYGGGA